MIRRWLHAVPFVHHLHPAPRLVALVALAALLPSAAAATGGANPLVEATERWRQGRGTEVPIASYLRHLVRADPHFRGDSTRTVHQLDDSLRTAFQGLQPLLAPELQTQFLGLSSDSLRAEWLRRYWRLRDPTPTTPENERRAEHERRVAHARREFAWKEPPHWDERGSIFIAFGAPDSVVETLSDVEEGVGFVPSHQEWLYLDERWVVEFEQPRPQGPWVLGRSSARLSHRPDLVERDKRRLGMTGKPMAASDYEALGDVLGLQDDRTLLAEGDFEGQDRSITAHEVRTDLRARNLLRKRREALVRAQHQIETGGERFVLRGQAKRSIWYVFDVDVFKGPPGRQRVEVHYQFNLADLEFAWKDSIYAASYRVEGVLYDRDVREAARDTYVETVKSPEFRATMAAQLIPGQLVFDVPEGTYRLGIRFVDQQSGAEGAYVTDIEVPRLDGRELALSDIQMASRIVFAGDDWRSRFVKKDRLVVPNPIGAYQRDKQLTGYVEIYGLELDPAGVCHYEITYSILPRTAGRPPGWTPAEGSLQRPFVRSTFKGDGGTRDLVEDLRIEIGSLASDAYDLVLTVRDLVSNAEATSRSSFSIVD
jgi:GWxTD domain-containing protein